MSASFPAAPGPLGGRFELIERAGAGGMSEVWRARDLRTGAVVAVKRMLEEQRDHEPRFAREVEVLAELSHPAIVRYEAHGLTPEHTLWLAMEWLEGEDLAHRLRQGPLTVAEAVAVVRRVAGALEVVHARGIVHRDLKPANLFLPDGDARRVKMLDFGIARLGDRSRVTRTGAILGTPGYMAPEQLQSGPTVGPEADVFALGCVLFECLTGRRAWTGDPLPVLAKILFEEAPRVVELCPDIPEDIDDLVARMLEKDPARRPRSGAELRAALDALQAAPPSMAATSLRARSPSLGPSERRVVSLVLVGARDAVATASGPTLPMAAGAGHDTLREAVAGHQGRLVELADGSALVTILGERVATDQAACAARCAIALKAMVPPDVPVAVATGRGERGERRPLGEAVDRAARLTAGAGAAIAIDEVTAGLLDARFQIQEREGGDGLELIGEHALTEGARTLLGKPTACVGRDRELRALGELFDDCVDRPGAAAALITAPAGVGKSRLAHELVRAVRERAPGTEVWYGRGDPLRAGSAFDLLGQALRGAASIHGGEPIDERRAKLAARVARHLPAADAPRVAALLGELAGVPFPDDASVDLRLARQEPALLADAMRKAFLGFLDVETAAHPVLLVLEDLHWGDGASTRLVDAALRDLAERPFMVLALARPEVHDVHPRLWADRPLDVVRLGELGRRASERLVRQVLGERVGADTIERLVSQSGGHAFYLEELIRASAEGRSDAPLPETVLAMVEARLSGLDDEARRALRAASVFGEVFWEGGVAALLGGAERGAHAGDLLRVLVDREVLIRREGSRFAGERELAFRHALLREGAYAMLTDADRALGHRLSAEWLERAGEADPMVLAEHLDRGGEPARAVPLLAQGARRAFVAGDTDELMARARRGLSLARALPEAERAALRDAEVEHLGLIVEAHGWRAEWREAFGYSHEILTLAQPGSLPWLTAATGQFALVMFPGQGDAVAPVLAQTLAVTPVPGAAVGLGQALVVGAYCLLCAGRTDDAVAFVRRAEEVIEPLRASDLAAAGWLDAGRGMCASWVDEDALLGLRLAEAAQGSFFMASHLRGVFVARFFVGTSLWALGARDRAAPELRATAEARVGYVSSQSAVLLTNDLADAGAIDEARALSMRVLESGRAHGFPLEEGRGRWMLAMTLRRAGELAAAEREARAAIACLGSLPFDRSGATVTLAAILLERGEAAAALTAAEEAMAGFAAGRTFGYYRDNGRLVHAEALLANGRDAEARAALAAARAHLLAKAEGIDDPALRASFLGAPERARILALAR